MSPSGIGAIVFACAFSGALAGMLVRGIVPEHHLSVQTENVVKLGMGMIATLTALVVSLLLASAKGSFDTKDGELRRFAADVILLDRSLAHLGAETTEARELLKRFATFKIDAMWPEEASHPVAADGWRLLEDVQDQVRAIAPGNDAQRWLQARALQISGDMAQTRWLLGEQMGGTIPQPFLVVLLFWLAALFASFGLFAPRNATVVAVLLVCSLSIAGAVFLILEMDRPFGGVIHISSAPMRDALAHLGQ